MTLTSVREHYTQDVDCCATGICNELVIETHDGGGGWYLTLHTERWALNETDLEALMETLKALLAREPKVTA